MKLRLWRLLAVVAAVLLAGGHLAATRGMGAIVLIGLCVRHMRPLPEFIQRAACRSCRSQAPRLGCRGLGPQGIPPHLSTEPFESFGAASGLSIDRRLGRSCNIGSAECDYGCGVAIRRHVNRGTPAPKLGVGTTPIVVSHPLTTALWARSWAGWSWRKLIRRAPQASSVHNR